MTRFVYSDELYHYGVKGQKHGVRRYQFEDGSLTTEGRSHYGVGDGQPRGSVERKSRAKKILKGVGIGLGVAGAAAAGYYGYKNKAKIGGAMRKSYGVAQNAAKKGYGVAKNAAEKGYEYVGRKAREGARAAKDYATRGYGVAKNAAEKGYEYVGRKAREGARAAKDYATRGYEYASNKVKGVSKELSERKLGRTLKKASYGSNSSGAYKNQHHENPGLRINPRKQRRR